MKTPTVCIDCSPLLLRSAGVKTYLYHWVRALRAQSPRSIRTFLAPADRGRLDHDGGLRMHPAKIAALVALSRLPRIACDLAIPRCDVFHISSQLRRTPSRPRLSTTLHDLTAWILPGCHMPANVAAEKEFADRVLKRASGIIADSENTKQDAIRILGISPEKIRVVYLGVPPEYFSVPAESVDTVKAAYKLARPYFLFVGTIEPRKNVDTLLAAWDGMPASFRRENDLVIAGMAGWRAEATMRRLLQAERDESGVRYLNYVPEADLPGLTAGAKAFVYPSLYEGFGIPVAQAMAAGSPVITSNVSSLPEVAGNAALLIDPRSTAELRSAMTAIDESADFRKRLAAASRSRSQCFKWETAAAESLRYFADLAG